MKLSHRIYPFIFILSVVYISGCAPRPIPTTTLGFIESRNRVLIATQESEFKDAVVSNITGRLEKQNLYIEITDLSNLTDKSTEQFKVIVIISPYKFFNFDKHVRNYLEGIDEQEQKKIILVATAHTPKWMDKGQEVDAISSASELTDADRITDEIIQRIDRILSR